MKRYAVILIVAALCATGAVAQEEDNDGEALKALQQEIRERKLEAELSWLLADLIENGAIEAGALQLVEQIETLASGKSLSLERTRRNVANRLEVADSDPEVGREFSKSVRDFNKDMLTRRLERRLAAAGFKAGSTCLRDVLDCISTVDTIYDNCLNAGLSWPYCMDLWLDLIGVCENIFDECAPG